MEFFKNSWINTFSIRQFEYHISLFIIVIIIIIVFCPRAGLSRLTQVPRLQFCPKAGLPLQTQEPKLQFYFLLLSAPHSLFSIWTDLKRSEKIPGAPTWRWGEWTWLNGSSGLLRNSPQELSVPSGFLTRSEIRKSQSPFAPVSLLKRLNLIEQSVSRGRLSLVLVRLLDRLY